MLSELLGEALSMVLQGLLGIGIVLFLRSLYRDLTAVFSGKDLR